MLDMESVKDVDIGGVKLGTCMDYITELYKKVGDGGEVALDLDCDPDDAFRKIVHILGDEEKAKYILKCGVALSQYIDYVNNPFYRAMAELAMKTLGVNVDLETGLKLYNSPCVKKLIAKYL
ncbi:MAG: hypothetical protein ACO2PN_29340 [Pyrobaculum sp.]|jgi:hypothetical protein